MFIVPQPFVSREGVESSHGSDRMATGKAVRVDEVAGIGLRQIHAQR